MAPTPAWYSPCCLAAAMRPASALIIDADSSTTTVLTEAVGRLGLNAVHAEKAAEAFQRFEQMTPAVVILDLATSDMPARQLLGRLGRGGEVPVIAVAEAGSLRAAVEAMRAGAVDVLDKRAAPHEIEQAIQAALPRLSAKGYRDIFGLSGVMQALEAVVVRLAAVSTPVLIRGESGAGHEVVARAIHELSKRSDRPFIKLSCAALPADRLQSELDRIDAVTQAGTAFLDEISEASAGVQTRLLDILAADSPNIRIIAATSADMYRLVAGGLFRGDLYERLAVATIDIPPLRERYEEIDSLAQSFLERFAREFRRPVPAVSESMAELLKSYDWPGNVRELENIVKRWVVLGGESSVREEIEARRAVTGRRHSAERGIGLGLGEIARRAAREAERMALQDALQRARGNRAAVARELKVSYKTLLQKLTEAGLASAPRAKGRR